MSPAWLRTVPGVCLDELNTTAALQSRTDRKYVLDTAEAWRLIALLGEDVRVLDISGRRSFGYHSVYFDTPDLASYHLSAHGRRHRFKVRTRTYLDTGTSFLEVKTRGRRAVTVKDRVPHGPAHADELDDAGHDYLERQLDEALGRRPDRLDELAPVLASDYRRTTFLLPESASRVTLDTDLVWTDASSGGGGRAFGLQDQVVLETKSAGAAGPLDRLLWRAGIRPARISKFATGLAVLHPGLPSNRWHRTLERHRIRPLTASRKEARR
ncbi:polyphosphate polymerase domain-containing protein [Zhihengliuella halotolerans]|uniref:VTC domain-containing protein n=1 Tax=Zhihengliuella halotolerans TaxID=370736 RepID=A0A4Q8AHW9_9MICC|nr:polyphosphate polymerase domain-containing protein [Zhihengliuella halotolerans]RZU63511.1 VTC domain-containing protein [Zhihengliuella halotolerans]